MKSKKESGAAPTDAPSGAAKKPDVAELSASRKGGDRIRSKDGKPRSRSSGPAVLLATRPADNPVPTRLRSTADIWYPRPLASVWPFFAPGGFPIEGLPPVGDFTVDHFLRNAFGDHFSALRAPPGYMPGFHGVAGGAMNGHPHSGVPPYIAAGRSGAPNAYNWPSVLQEAAKHLASRRARLPPGLNVGVPDDSCGDWNKTSRLSYTSTTDGVDGFDQMSGSAASDDTEEDMEFGEGTDGGKTSAHMGQDAEDFEVVTPGVLCEPPRPEDLPPTKFFGTIPVVSASGSEDPPPAASDVEPDEKMGESEPAAVPRGSAGHATGTCRPCAHFWKTAGCNKGDDCERCHLCDQDAFKKYREAYVAKQKHARTRKVSIYKRRTLNKEVR